MSNLSGRDTIHNKSGQGAAMANVTTAVNAKQVLYVGPYDGTFDYVRFVGVAKSPATMGHSSTNDVCALRATLYTTHGTDLEVETEVDLAVWHYSETSTVRPFDVIVPLRKRINTGANNWVVKFETEEANIGTITDTALKIEFQGTPA